MSMSGLGGNEADSEAVPVGGNASLERFTLGPWEDESRSWERVEVDLPFPRPPLPPFALDRPAGVWPREGEGPRCGAGERAGVSPFFPDR